MNEWQALSLYTKACREALNIDENRPQTWNKLHRHLRDLRDVLKCRKCYQLPNFENKCDVCCVQLCNKKDIPFQAIKNSRDLCRTLKSSGAYAVMVSRPKDAAMVDLIDRMCNIPSSGDSDVSLEGTNEESSEDGSECADDCTAIAVDGSLFSENSRGSYGSADSEMVELIDEMSPLTGDSDVSSEGANEGLESSENASGFAEDGLVCSEDSTGSNGGVDSKMFEETTDNAELPVACFEQDNSLDGWVDGNPVDDFDDDNDTMTQSTGEETAIGEPTKTDVISCRCGSRLKKYSLKGNCVTRHCLCVKNQRKCGKVCRCRICKN